MRNGDNYMHPLEVEKENLAVHVDLCSIRYQQLDTRLTNLENKVSMVHNDILEGQKGLTKVIITTAGTIIASILTVVIAILIRGV
jgi:hypothetical protein